METLISIVSLLFAAMAFYLQYHASGRETQAHLVSLIRRLLGATGRVFGYLLVLAVFAMSAAGIVVFWTSSEPIKRPEVVMVILHIINAFMYGYLTVAIPGKAIRDRLAPTAEPAEAAV